MPGGNFGTGYGGGYGGGAMKGQGYAQRAAGPYGGRNLLYFVTVIGLYSILLSSNVKYFENFICQKWLKSI